MRIVGKIVKEGRTPCINPRCRRTADATKFPDEMICGTCFRALPLPLRAEFRLAWREYRKWNKRYFRTSDEIKKARIGDIVGRWAFRIDSAWINIRNEVIKPEKPAGIDAFLKEAGLE